MKYSEIYKKWKDNPIEFWKKMLKMFPGLNFLKKF